MDGKRDGSPNRSRCPDWRLDELQVVVLLQEDRPETEIMEWKRDQPYGLSIAVSA